MPVTQGAPVADRRATFFKSFAATAEDVRSVVGVSQRSTCRPTSGAAVRASPTRSARVSKCLTDDGCHRVPPRGVRSRMASSWAAICWSVRSGAAALMPATRRTSRSSLGWGRARSSSLASMMPSSASRRTVRRSRSTVQGLPRPARGSGPARRRPRAGSGASAARSAARSPLRQDAVQMRGIAARPDLADGVRVAGAQARIAADPAAARAAFRPDFGALGDQRAFELGDGAQHLQARTCLAAWWYRSDRAGCGNARRAASSCSMTASRWLTERARRSSRTTTRVSPAADLAQQARQHRPAAIGAGGVLFEDRGAAGGAQFVELRIGALFLGGDARVADQAACGGGFSGFRRRHAASGSSEANLQFNKVFVNDRLQRWPMWHSDALAGSSGEGHGRLDSLRRLPRRL